MTASFGSMQSATVQPGLIQAGSGPASDLPATSADLIKETSTNAFRADVIQESMKQPVLVDFWAPWCGPCKQLTPIIENVVKAAGGKVKLVKMDIDKFPEIAGQLGVQSIPAVFAFSKGQPVDGFMGALPESQIKAFIERLVGPIGPGAVEQMLIDAAQKAAENDLAGAAELYGAVLTEDPAQVKALAGLAKAYFDMGENEQAEGILSLVPEDKQADPDVVGIRAALDLAAQAAKLGDTSALDAAIAANPLDHQARFDLAIALNARNDRDAAVNHLIDIIKQDRTWMEDGARKQLLQLFDAWGPADSASLSARRKLSSALFS